MSTGCPLRIVIIDDSPLQGLLLQQVIERRLGAGVAVEVYRDPITAIGHLSDTVDLLLIDWQMPEMDGKAVLEEAALRGIDRKRIIVSSAYPANRLHEVFDCTGCLAVIEKGEQAQQEAFLMILDGVMKRHRDRSREEEEE